ncbi:hypothetical protein JS531_03665 [Bifidobacterium sp. CP2]|uniref:hypothetical protein n=1 Tax=Bifidobacterium sp. CP2 TaxID=2809025 RepID=UPI001BDBC605|nr:hypothetical protein [Bifidobacterium sp. CP2]MBT1181080.1 hypothetical protein [Bifidobacterium sp. CP2]
MTRVPAGGRLSFRTREDPFDPEDRGWTYPTGSLRGDAFPGFSLPAWLFYMCVSGRDWPWNDEHGRTKQGNISFPYYRARAGWLIDLVMIRPSQSDDVTLEGYVPVKPLGRTFTVWVLKAPFPLTLDRDLIAYGACSIGETEWVPFAPLINGRCSQEMLRLMNMFPHKPAFIIYRGVLHLWINVEHWGDLEPKVSYFQPQPYIELELFRAYRVYYEQLRRELPAPFMGPVGWPDQCDPRFPLPGDPRGAHYGMWIYSGGLTYGENATETYGIR